MDYLPTLSPPSLLNMGFFNRLHVIPAFIAALALPNVVEPQASITDDSFFYGQSPPVYPSRKWLHLYLLHAIKSTTNRAPSSDARLGAMGVSLFQSICPCLPDDFGRKIKHHSGIHTLHRLLRDDRLCSTTQLARSLSVRRWQWPT